MIDLTNIEEIKKLDPKDVYLSTGMLADQCQQIIDEYFDKDFYNTEYRNVKNIVVAGMGGSAYGGHIIPSLYHDKLTVPLVVNSDYTLPAFTNSDSLVMLTSYSGSTEEVINCAADAQKKGAKITGFSSGGSLGSFLKDKYPGFSFDPKHNPSGQPRLGTGYMIMSTIVLLRSLGVLPVEKEEIEKAVGELRSLHNDIQKSGIEIAHAVKDYIPVIFSGEFLNGNAHVMRNQFNETAKSFSAYAAIPELNHHLMEGLKNPSGHKLITLLLTSNLYSEKIQKRATLTEDVVSQNNLKVVKYQTRGTTKLAQVLEVLSLGGYITVYLALLYGLDPSLIPWVDYFKEKLKS